MGLEGMYAVWLRDAKAIFRKRSRLLSSIMRPVLWLIILGNGLRPAFQDTLGDYTQFIFPGVLGMTLIFSSIFSATSVIWDREFGFLKEVLVSPIPRSMVVLGKSLGGTTQATFQGLLTLAFAPIIGLFPDLWTLLGLFLAMILISFALTNLGLVIAGRMTSFEGFGAMTNFIVMPMYFLSGAIYPLTDLPLWLTILTWINPLTYGVDLMRGILLDSHAYPVALNVGILASFGAIMFFIAIPSFGKQK
jgi:ABC-2 type transport system permease protein